MALNLLVVDDSATMRRMIIRTLKVAGLPLKAVLEAGDGTEALEKLAGHDVDLALLDLNMPKMGGMDALAHIRKDPRTRDLPVVVVSTEGSDTRIKSVREQRAGFLRKPFAPEALVAAVADAIGGVDDDDDAE
jgi:two-component system chemotaxis response regulator CheY